MKQYFIKPLTLFAAICFSLFVNAQTNTFPSSGNVGIGTTSPVHKLEVKGNIINTNPSMGWIGLTGDLPGYANNMFPTLKTSYDNLYFSTGGKYTAFMTKDGIFGLVNSSQAPIVCLSISGASWLNGGNVGIGTTNPTKKLHVNGVILIQGGQSPSGPGILMGGDPSGSFHGEYGIEYNTDPTPAYSGLNFWKPWPAAGAANYIMYLRNDGNIGMGVTPDKINSAYRLSVNGAIRATKIVVEIGWADYVFKKDYKLMPLSDLENFISSNKHLPNIPSANEVEEKGLDVGAVQAKQMEKIEELTLYIISLQHQIDELKRK